MTHFAQTSGAVLLIVEIHMRTYLPLLIPLETNWHIDLLLKTSSQLLEKQVKKTQGIWNGEVLRDKVKNTRAANLDNISCSLYDCEHLVSA